MKLTGLLLCSFSFSLAMADVSGRVSLANGHAAAGAVVYLAGGEHAQIGRNATVDQRSRTFIPHISAVPVGTTVEFPNHDTVFHNVFADYDAKRFDLGMYPKGASRKETFSKPGLVVLMCSIHPEMSAYIMVVDTPYYAVCDRSGSFSIPGVRPGRYEMKVWHESGQVESRTIQVQGSQEIDVTTHKGRP